MATYSEILDLVSNNQGEAFRRRVTVATVVAADTIRLEAAGTANHANRMVWAKLAVTNPEREAQRLIWAVLAQNRTYSAAVIAAADDATVQSAVNAAVDMIAGV